MIVRKYYFELLEANIPNIRQKSDVIPADSITGAIRKFARKYELEPPAYWDEPAFDQFIEISFKRQENVYRYHITW